MTVPDCGTLGAYRRHRKRKEIVDRACLNAWDDYRRSIGSPENLARRAEREEAAARDAARAVQAAAEQGASVRHIARQVGRSEPFVKKALSEAGIRLGARRSVSNLEEANERRATQAASRDAQLAKAILDGPKFRDLDPRWQAAVRARVRHPDWSFAELAACLGVTKDMYVNYWRSAQRNGNS